MNKKALIYVAVALAVIIAGFAVVMYKQKTAGLATGTPTQLSQGKTSSTEVEDNIEAKARRGKFFLRRSW